MENFTVENWEMIRNLLGILIFLVAMLYIEKGRPDFQQTLTNELSNKNIKKIKKQVERLKDEQHRTAKLLSEVGDQSPLIHTAVDLHPEKFPAVAKAPELLLKEADPTPPLSAAKFQLHTKYTNPYEQVRQCVADGLTKEEIYEKMDIPKAEIDLMLKFNKLAKLSQVKDDPDTALRAFG